MEDGTKATTGAGGPLAGIRVLDLSRVLAGPWTTQCLADLGAEVLKVERPGEGDETRSWSPPYMDGLAAYYTCANRSKKSLCLDLKSDEGRQRAQELARHADILVENYRAGTLERYGLGVEALHEINPQLIYCSISGYGRTGPNADRAGYDYVIQAESGLMSVTGFPDGPPTKVGVAVSDLFAGFYATQSIIAALYERERTQRGRFLDVALFDCQLAALANVASNAMATGEPPPRYGNGHANVVPYDVIEASDGPMVVAVGNDRQFQLLCEGVLEAPELAQDPGFRTNTARLANRERLLPELRSRFAQASRAHWEQRMAEYGLPAGALRNVDEALNSPQVRARSLIHTFASRDSTPGMNPIKVIKYPIPMDDASNAMTPPPQLGEGGEELARRWMADSTDDG